MLLLVACTGSDEPADPRPPRLPAALEHLFPTRSPAPFEEGNWLTTSCGAPLEHLRRVRRGFYAGRSYDVVFVPRYPNSVGAFDYTTHGGPWDYLQRVPLVLVGPGYIRPLGAVSVDRETSVADIAPTLAELLGVNEPNEGPGRPLDEVLVAQPARSDPPKIIVTVVWDGGGTDVLQAWPDAWPRLAELMDQGAALTGAVVGSAPSTTPPVHATIGTGVWPSEHGIVDLTQRRGDTVPDSYIHKEGPFDPVQLEVPTLADVYDRQMDNAPRIALVGYRGWHLGMMGHGARIPGGDKDVAAIIDRDGGPVTTSREWYSLPAYLRDLDGLEEDTRAADLADGELDGRWRSVDLNDPVTLQYSPAYTLYQTRLLEALITKEDLGGDAITDMVFVNYKQIDDVGHFYNMLSPEMEEIVEYSDAALGELVDLLDATAGRGNWVVVLTADHGETPDLRAIGGWPIDQNALRDVVAGHFDVAADDLFLQERTMGFWFDSAFRRRHGITLEEVADVIIDLRLGDTLGEGEDPPAMYADHVEDPLFEAAFPGDRLDDVWRCARRRATS